MAEWIAIVVALLGPIVLHFVREGYVRRQLEDIESRLSKGFEYDELHFSHAGMRDIHQTAMSREVTSEKFANLECKMDSYSESLTNHIQDDAKSLDKIDAKLDQVRQSVHSLREDIPKWLDQAAERAVRLMGGK